MSHEDLVQKAHSILERIRSGEDASGELASILIQLGAARGVLESERRSRLVAFLESVGVHDPDEVESLLELPRMERRLSVKARVLRQNLGLPDDDPSDAELFTSGESILAYFEKRDEYLRARSASAPREDLERLSREAVSALNAIPSARIKEAAFRVSGLEGER